jgi:membrane fusion protein (multidrug efflux system)
MVVSLRSFNQKYGKIAAYQTLPIECVFNAFMYQFCSPQIQFMRASIRIAGLIVVVSLFFAGCKSKKDTQGGGRGNARQKGELSVEGFVVGPSSVSEDVEVAGTLMPAEETQIRAEVNGRVVQMNIQEGTVISKGTLLVKLFDQDLQAQLNKLEVQLKIADKTVERQKELLSINGISQQDYDLSSLNADNLRADIQSIKIAIAKTEIRAPYSGQLGLRYISMGSYVGPTDIITTLREVDQLKIEFSVPEKYAKNIAKGYTVKFRVDGGKQEHVATVMATEGNVDPSTRTLRIRALVKGKNAELVPGVFARVNLQLGQDDKALMIPSQAIIPMARNKQVIVFRKDSAIFRVIETGVRDSAYVQVTTGLQKGDTIITTGLMAIRPATKVKIAKVNRLQ